MSTYVRGYPPKYDRLCDYKPSTQLNVLVLGCCGDGKSSFINNLFSDLNEVRQVASVKFLEFGRHTQDYAFYRISHNIKIFDTWGFVFDGRDEIYPLEMMLDAKVKVGQKVNEKIKDVEVSQARLIDICVFVICPDKRDNILCLREMRKYYQLAKSKGVAVVVVIPKMDLVIKNILLDKDLEHALQVCHRGKEFTEIRSLVVKHFEDENATVIPIINYRHSDTMPHQLIFHLCRNFVKVFIKIMDEHLKLPPTKQYNIFEGEETLRLEHYNLVKTKSSVTPTEKQIEFYVPMSMEENKFRHGYIAHKFFSKVEIDQRIYRLYAVTTLQDSEHVIVGLFNPDFDYCFECVRAKNEDTLAKLKGTLMEKNLPKYEFLRVKNKGETVESWISYDQGMTNFLVISDLEGEHLILKEKPLCSFQLFVESHIQNEKVQSYWRQSNEVSLKTVNRKFESLVYQMRKARDVIKSQHFEIEKLKKDMEDMKKQHVQELTELEKRTRDDIINLKNSIKMILTKSGGGEKDEDPGN